MEKMDKTAKNSWDYGICSWVLKEVRYESVKLLCHVEKPLSLMDKWKVRKCSADFSKEILGTKDQGVWFSILEKWWESQKTPDCSPYSSHGEHKALKGFSRKFVATGEAWCHLSVSGLCHTAFSNYVSPASTMQQLLNSCAIVLQQLLSMCDLLMREIFYPLVINNSSVPYLKTVRWILWFFLVFISSS